MKLIKLKFQDLSFALPFSRLVPNFCIIFLKEGLPNFLSFHRT